MYSAISIHLFGLFFFRLFIKTLRFHRIRRTAPPFIVAQINLYVLSYAHVLTSTTKTD